MIRLTRPSVGMLSVVLSFMVLCAAIAGTHSETAVLGSWLGEVEMGGSLFRLVFTIEMDNTGRLAGTVDSPDKGITGIPLSRVRVSNDSVVFEISAAQAVYRGTFSDDGNAIEGIWREGETSYSMTLVRTIEITEPANLQNSARIPELLDYHYASRHFDFYASQKDRTILDALSKTLEGNYRLITEHLRTEFTEKIRVYIYPDIKTFHSALNVPDAPEWAVGAATMNELRMVSPLNPGNYHTRESLMQAIVHELVHAAVLNARKPQGLDGLPQWLNEGYAFYEAGQMTDDMLKAAKLNAREDAPPSWMQLDRANTAEFGDMNGYVLSATIIEFLVNTYGLDRLIRLIKAPEEIESIYRTSQRDLEKKWLEYLRNN